MVALMVMVSPAWAFQLDVSQDWCDHTHLQGRTLTGTGGTTLVPTWDGTTVTYSPTGGLDFNGNDLTCETYNSYLTPPVTFDLGGGTNDITGGGKFQAGSGNYNNDVGKVTFQNVRNISLGDIELRQDDGDGMTVSQTGSFTANDIVNWHRGLNGHVSVTGGGGGAGGAFAANSLDNYWAKNTGLTVNLGISGYTGVSFAGTVPNHAGATYEWHANTSINAGAGRGGQAVAITDIGTGGIVTAGGIWARCKDQGISSITLSTTGPVSIGGELDANCAGWFSGGRTVGVSVNAGGDVSVGGLLTYGNDNGVTGNSRDGGPISVGSTGGGLAVTGPIDTACYSGSGSGGDLTVTTANDIVVSSTINLNGTSDAKDGVLSMNATGPNAKITVQDLDCALFRPTADGTTYTFNAGGGASYILGHLANFDSTDTDPDELWIPTDQVVYYDPGVTGNEYLGAQIYTVYYGTTPGGLLKPLGSEPIPEPATLGLVGLAALGFKRKRS
jgi:hypothetical protein